MTAADGAAEAPDDLHGAIAEWMWAARVQCEIGERYAAIGDDVGLEYAVRRLMGYVRVSAQTLAEIKAQKAKPAA